MIQASPQHRRPRVLAALAFILVLALFATSVHEALQFAETRIGVGLFEDEQGLLVMEVVPGTPAARAGLVVDDRLLAIGEYPVRTIADYDRAVFEVGRGAVLEFRVRRQERELVAGVTPGMPAEWWLLLIRGLVSLGCVGVGALSLFIRHQDVRARLLASLFFLIAYENALPRGLFEDSWWPVVVALSFYVGTAAQLAVELHLAAVVPRPRRRHPGIAWLYAIAAVLAVIGSVTYLQEILGHQLFPWTAEGFDDLIHQIVLPLWAGALVLLLGRAIVNCPEREGRLQVTLILLGVLPWVVYIGVSWAQGFPGRESMAWSHDVMPYLLIFYPAAVFVAIFRYRFLDLESMVRRSLVYGALTGALVLTFYAILGAGGALLSLLLQGKVDSIWTLSIATVVLGLLFSPLRRFTQRLIDQRFFPEQESMRRSLIALTAELPTLDQPEQMAQHLVRELRRIFTAGSATLLLAEPQATTLSRAAHSGATGEEGTPTLELDDPGIERLAQLKRPAHVEHLASLSPALICAVRATAVQVVVPLFSESRLAGVLLLGEKTTGRSYSREEIELLGLLAQNVATAFDNLRLARSANYEDLTGLKRREAILAKLSQEVERAKRYGRPLTIAMADVDHFKAINDQFGHLEGDRALRGIADEMSSVLRGSDGLGRYGGEEFLCVFPFPHVTHLGRDPVRDLVAQADRALYRAKAGGRNRVETSEDPASS